MAEVRLWWARETAPDGSPRWRLTHELPPRLQGPLRARILSEIADEIGIVPTADGWWVALATTTVADAEMEPEIDWHPAAARGVVAVCLRGPWAPVAEAGDLEPLAPAPARRGDGPLDEGSATEEAPSPAAVWMDPITLLQRAEAMAPLPPAALTWMGERIGVTFSPERPDGRESDSGIGPWAHRLTVHPEALEESPIGRRWLTQWLLEEARGQVQTRHEGRMAWIVRTAVVARTALRAGHPLGDPRWANLAVPADLARWVRFRGHQVIGRTPSRRPLRRQWAQWAPGTQLRLLVPHILAGPRKDLSYDNAELLTELEPQHLALIGWLLDTLPQWADAEPELVAPQGIVSSRIAEVAEGSADWAARVDRAWHQVLAQTIATDLQARDGVTADRTARRPTRPSAPLLSPEGVARCNRVLAQWQAMRGGRLDLEALRSAPAFQRYAAGRLAEQLACSNPDTFNAAVRRSLELEPSGLGPGDWFAQAPVAPVWLRNRLPLLFPEMDEATTQRRIQRIGRGESGSVWVATGDSGSPAFLIQLLDNPALGPDDVAAWIRHWHKVCPTAGSSVERSKLVWQLACMAARMGVLADPDLLAELAATPQLGWEPPTSQRPSGGMVSERERDSLQVAVACLARAGAWAQLDARFASISPTDRDRQYQIEIGQRLLLACSGGVAQWVAQQPVLGTWLRSLGPDLGPWEWTRRRLTTAIGHGLRLGIGQVEGTDRRLWTPWLQIPDPDLRLAVVGGLGAMTAAPAPAPRGARPAPR